MNQGKPVELLTAHRLHLPYGNNLTTIRTNKRLRGRMQVENIVAGLSGINSTKTLFE